jgi:UDP-glucose 4-epimerase
VVTGGAGFIGSHLVDRLVHLASQVVVFDDFSTGLIENLKTSESPRLEIVRADINDSEKIRIALKDTEIIFHEAALVNVPLSFEEPDKTNRINVDGTKTLIQYAAGSSAEKIILASSSAVYGDVNIFPTPEDSPKCPISPYGWSKLKAEELCLKASTEAGLDVAILRYFNVYGERSVQGPYSGVICRFAERLLAGSSPLIFGDGKQTRDFIHVEDVVRANVLAASKKRTASNVFNVGTGSHISIQELAELETRLIIGNEDGIPISYLPAKPGDIMNSYGDVSRIKTGLGFVAAIPLDAGLARYLRWFASFNTKPDLRKQNSQ